MLEQQELLDQLAYNEALAQKFFDIEVRILTLTNLRELFQELLQEISEKFNVPFVWITLIDDEMTSPLLKEIVSSVNLNFGLKIMAAGPFHALLGRETRPFLANRDLKKYKALMPQGENYPLGSLALAPLTMEGRVIGSLNHGDPSNERYMPGLETTYLERMAVKVSICLSNLKTRSMVKVLSGLLPICAECKRIRDDQGYWNRIEEYIRENSEAEFSHGLCPECAKTLYPEFYEKED